MSKTKIEIEEKIKALASLFRMLTQEPHSVLLIHLNKYRGEPMTLPLLFPQLHELGTPVLVLGIFSLVKQQLAIPDFDFQDIPDQIENDTHLKNSLFLRVERIKGLQFIMREMNGFLFLSDEIRKKIKNVAEGKKSELT